MNVVSSSTAFQGAGTWTWVIAADLPRCTTMLASDVVVLSWKYTGQAGRQAGHWLDTSTEERFIELPAGRLMSLMSPALGRAP